jgi:hypothetical protein
MDTMNGSVALKAPTTLELTCWAEGGSDPYIVDGGITAVRVTAIHQEDN